MNEGSWKRGADCNYNCNRQNPHRVLIAKLKSTVRFGCVVFGRSLLAVGASQLILASAFAGQILHFKSGPVDSRSYDRNEVHRFLQNETKPRYFVVQYKEKIRQQDRARLSALGARVVRYIPDDGLVVLALPKAIRSLLKSNSEVQAVFPYAADWKISPEFDPGSVFSARTNVEVFIRLFPGAEVELSQNGKSATYAHQNRWNLGHLAGGLASVVTQLKQIPGVEVRYAEGAAIVALVKRSQLDKVAAIDGVEFIQPNPKMALFHMNEDGFTDGAEASAGDFTDLTGFESGTRLMNFDSAWNRGWDGTGQIVAMADTGLDTGNMSAIHADFMGRIPAGYAFGMFSKSWEDPMGHGTHVAGSVMGDGRASGGKVTGGALGAKLIAEGMWSPILNNLTVPPKLQDLFVSAYTDGARIHTNSWGSARNLGAYDAFAQQVDEYVASHPDMLIVFAAGNSGVDADKDGRIDPGSVSSPGTAKNVLTVGASENYVFNGGIQRTLKELGPGRDNWSVEPLGSSRLSDHPQGIAAFSSRGPTQDGRLKPEVVAPGTNILSVRSSHKDAEALWGAYNKDYVWSGGTSMATPLAAGAAAVVRQYLVQNRGLAQPSAAVLKAALMHSAVDLYPGQFGEVGERLGQELLTVRPNDDEGYGRVDVARATSLGHALIVDDGVGLGTGESHPYLVTIQNRTKLTATLVYTDAAGSAGAAKSLVNDLDLILIDSAGKQYSLNDRTNNAEMIEVIVPPGDYEIRVTGFNVPQALTGKQPYAIIVSVQ